MPKKRKSHSQKSQSYIIGDKKPYHNPGNRNQHGGRDNRRSDGRSGDRSSEQRGGGSQTWKIGTQGIQKALENLPYDFVPVNLEKKVTCKPVWHDGTNREGLLTGELRCTLTALTPLLCGNDQFPLQFVSSNKKHKLNAKELPQEKTLIEPLRLSDGRVAIAGTALKGMLRQSVGALLNAPMERVEEGSYSYRPNLDLQGRGYLQHSPALVESEPNEQGQGMRIRLMKVSPKSPKTLEGALDHSPRARFGGQVVRYYGSIDGEGILASESEDPKYKHWMEYDPRLVSNGVIQVPEQVVRYYWKTLEHLADDKHGHISNRHPQLPNDVKHLKKAILSLKTKALKKGNLVYVEHDDQKRVTSFGHHFRYRWRYADTVRNKDGKEREILRPCECETTAQCPQKLSGARLLFGYTSGEKMEGTQGIGEGDFSRLAGRLAFNMAVEQADDPGDTNRFVRGSHGSEQCVSLKALGPPRPSAVEFYVDQAGLANRQDQGILVTYGDLPGVGPSGELRGRKFYRHQPDAATQRDLYEAEAKSEDHQGKIASLAKYLCRPETDFQFTLRFDGLRPWELGAVLIALQPELAKRDTPDDPHEDDPEYALKLGHGRPLGLGSVKVTVNQLMQLNGKDGRLSEGPPMADCLTQAREKIDAGVLNAWLKIHEFRSRRGKKLTYPVYAERRNEPTIYNWHTTVRGEHSKGRRLKK